MKKHFPAILLVSVFCACTGLNDAVMDLGCGFHSVALHSPWGDSDNTTRFSSHNTSDRFFFSFDVEDSTVLYADTVAIETGICDEDRVEIYFCQDKDLKKAYFCAEIDPLGRIMDYKAEYCRKFDYGWSFSTLEVNAGITSWGYRVNGSVSLDELRALGIDEDGFAVGIFQADLAQDREAVWYSLSDSDIEEADFHCPESMLSCKMTQQPAVKGVVVYPNDITSVGLDEWRARMDQSGINLIGLHAATNNDPLDTLEAFIKSPMGKDFLELCSDRGVDVEYEIHALQFLLPRSLFEEHPEYFRMDEAGNRCAEFNMCFTSAEAVAAMRPQLEEMLKWMKPTTHRYYFWTDDVSGKYCHCEHCRNLSPSEQALVYENNLLNLIREFDPEATMAHLSYNQTIEAPCNVRPDDGVFLEYAPLGRDYSQPLTPEMLDALKDNLLAFPANTFHVLEYWLDESMFCGWKRDGLVPLPFGKDEWSRDIVMYRSLGAADFTTFATWLYGDYLKQYGSTEQIFTQYGAAL